MPVLSPMRAHCRAIKAARPGARAVFIGPCISKKYEADEEPAADACLTFQELREWMGEAGVSFEPAEESAPRLRARAYPAVGGILRTLAPGGYEAIAIDGAARCIAALEELRTRKREKVFLEMSACEGGCLGGRCSGSAPGDRWRARSGWPGTRAGVADEAPPEDMALAFPGRPSRACSRRRGRAAGLEPHGQAHEVGSSTAARAATPPAGTRPSRCARAGRRSHVPDVLKRKGGVLLRQIIRNTPNAILVMDENLIVQQVNRAALELFRLKSADDILRARRCG